MDQLPPELLLHIISFLEVHDNVRLHLVSQLLFKIARDNELWKTICLTSSHAEAARKRRNFLAGPLPVQELRVYELQRRAAALSAGDDGSERLNTNNTTSQRNDVPSKATTERARAMANWDPSYLSEKVDWYGEYVARHAPLSMSWLQQPNAGTAGPIEKREIRGLGLLRNHHDGIVVAPLDDGSICLWNIGRDDEAPNANRGEIIARSKPGLLSVKGPTSDLGPIQRSNAYMTSTGVVECGSLNEVDLSTLQVTSHEKYPFSISALSETTYPTPLTIGTTLSVHLHDPRQAQNTRPCSTDSSNRLDYPLTANQNDFYRLRSGDDLYYAPLFHPNPLSILHLSPQSIYIAGRFPSILTYDRRTFPKLQKSIHSGARLSSLSSLPSVPSPTIIACGEYNGKGSLELYPLSSSQPNPTKNRTTASSSKLLSLTPHGTRIAFSDSDGGIKWVERDGRTLIRRWNINAPLITTTPLSEQNYMQPRGLQQQHPSCGRRVRGRGLFVRNGDEMAGDVVRKLVTVPSRSWGNREELLCWTGEKVGILGFRNKGRFTWGGEGEEEKEEEEEGEMYADRMRLVLEREADGVRFVSGFGLM